MKKNILLFCCYLNRNLRYGKSKNRLIQFVVIRTRSCLKKVINRNTALIHSFGEREIKLSHAGKMRLQTTDYIDNWLFTGADFEPHIVKLFLALLKSGNNVIDIGANIGYFSLISAKRIAPDGLVFAFEPSPNTFRKLEGNIGLNNITNIKLFNKAVADKPGVLKFNIPTDSIQNSGRSSFRKLEENNKQIEVDTIQLDQFLGDLPEISLIKMDIEGAEMLALQGMQKLLKRDAPVIIMELSDFYLKQLDSSSEELVVYLKNLDYEIYIAGEEIVALSQSNLLEKFQHDILCIPFRKKDQYLKCGF